MITSTIRAADQNGVESAMQGHVVNPEWQAGRRRSVRVIGGSLHDGGGGINHARIVRDHCADWIVTPSPHIYNTGRSEVTPWQSGRRGKTQGRLVLKRGGARSTALGRNHHQTLRRNGGVNGGNQLNRMKPRSPPKAEPQGTSPRSKLMLEKESKVLQVSQRK